MTNNQHHPRQQHGHNLHQQQHQHQQHQHQHQQQHHQQSHQPRQHPNQHPHQHPQQQQPQQHQQQQHQQQQHQQQQQQHHNSHHPHHPQNSAYVPGHMQQQHGDGGDLHQHQHHHHQPQAAVPQPPQQPVPPQPQPSQVQQGSGGPALQPPPSSQQQQQPQPQPNLPHNSVVKHHPQHQQSSMPPNAPQMNQPHHPHPLANHAHPNHPHAPHPNHPHPHHNHNHHHHNPQHHQHHPLHHQPQMQQISPSVQQQQWVGPPHPATQTQSSQAQNHHHHQPPLPPQGQPPQQQQQQQQQAQHHQSQPPPPPAQQQQQPQQQHLPGHHHMPTPMMISQQYQNSGFLGYPHMTHHHFVPPPGHVPPQYEHPQATSHQTDPVNMNSQQQPVNINNHPSNNMPLNRLPAPVNSNANTDTTSVHPMNNGPMMDMSNRLPINPHYIPYMINPNHVYPFALSSLNYPGGPIPSPSPAMMASVRVPSGPSGIRQPHYDPQNPVTPIVTTAALSQPPVPKPSLPTVTSTQTATPYPPPKPREKKALKIVDPATGRALTEAELKASGSKSESLSPKDSGIPRISSKDPLISNKESLNEDKVIKNLDVVAPKATEPTSELEQEVPKSESEQKVAPESPRLKSESPAREKSPTAMTAATTVSATTVTTTMTATTIQTPPEVATAMVSQTLTQVEEVQVEFEQPANIDKKSVVENGDVLSKIDADAKLVSDMASVNISGGDDHKPNDDSAKHETPVKKPTLPDLPYAAGQFSPLNREGSKKYSMEFLKAVAKEMNIELDTSSARMDFTPHYMMNSANFRDYGSSSQGLPRRGSSQQVVPKPRKVIATHSLQQEVELKTAEKPWKPELEIEKSKSSEGEMDTKRLLKVFRGHLNKLTPQKYDSLIEKIGALDLKGPGRLNSVIDLVFDKAVDEPGFCELYAQMCKVIAKNDSEFCFHLVKKCQEEFETSDLYEGLNIEERKAEIEKETDPSKKKLMFEELYEDQRMRRKKYLGTIKLIGEMYKLGLLLPKIIGLCMHHLIDEASNENIECLCSLIATVGAKMASEQDVAIIRSLKNTLDLLNDIAHHKKANEVFILESRIKFKILDTIDLSRRNWTPRLNENNPKKIDEIREESKEEAMRQQHHNHSSQSNKNIMKFDDRDRERERERDRDRDRDRDRKRVQGLYNNPLPKGNSRW